MKKAVLAVALAMAFPLAFAQAQSDANSQASSNPVISSGNSGANSNSNSSSNPNNANAQYIQLNTLTPEQQQVDQNVHYSGSQRIKNVPGIAMSGPASGPCTGMSGGVGVAGPGFGVGLNGSKVDDGCTVRENTRVLGQLFQALDTTDPMKAQARDALIRSMTILDNMNSKIAGDYAPPQQANVAATPVMMPVAANPSGCAAYQGNDPIIRDRVCGK